MNTKGYVDVIENQADILKFQGIISRIIFRKEDFLIGQILADKKTITFKGHFLGVEANENIIIYGKWVYHSKYGNQIEVSSWERPVPTIKEQTLEFLSSGLVDGVGKSRAKRIVDKLGSNAIKIIREKGECSLIGIKGIGSTTANKIYLSIIETFELQDIVKHLSQYGISANVCVKLYKIYGVETVNKITKNPYLITDIEGISFTKADQIAKSIGIKPISSFRLNACLIYMLNNMCNKYGHTYVYEDDLIKNTLNTLNVGMINSEELVEYNELQQSLYNLEEKEIIFEGKKVYSKRLYSYETYIARKISILLNNRGGEAMPKIDKILKRYQSQNSILLAEQQREAIYKMMQENVLIITGKPGTGKTTTLKAMLDIYEDIYPKNNILLSAPTGRASRKMAEATGRTARTVHSMLGYRQGDIPTHNEGNPLEVDLIVVDEWSMADLNLTYWLLSAINKGSKIIFIGDIDQLPSISPGNVLADLIEAELPTVRLDQIFRQAEQSQIVQNAFRINEGKELLIDTSKDDFYFIHNYNDIAIQNLTIKSVLRFIELGYELEDILVLSPMRKGEVGIELLNNTLREYINPKNPLKNEIKIGDRYFREGDKVMQNVNNPELDIYNGDLGIITRIERIKDKHGKEKDIVVCDFEGKEAIYERSLLKDLELGYALTIHKSQGGEASVVIMPITFTHKIMLARNLYYTGITRAKEKVVLIGNNDAMNYAINNNKIIKRNSLLDQRIMKEVYELNNIFKNKEEVNTN